SNHYGMAGWYAIRAMKEGLIGISMTNTTPLMAPTRSKEAALGTNPIALGASAKNGDKFLLDMATTAVSLGKVEIQIRKDEPIPDGWAQDSSGNVTNFKKHSKKVVMPLGGFEITSGYKGYGLGAMVEILCGVMAGSNYSTHVRDLTEEDCEANLGQVFIAVDPNQFANGFEDRLTDMNDILRSCKPTDPKNPVLVPGDKEKHNMEDVNKAGGIQYLPNQLQTCENLAKRLNIKP
uniref:Malate dehydrogenase n=1 Tax=Megaselia scalaris TaxID=36166 RepID=T1H5V5_MEGSC